MRQQLLSIRAKEISYEIREIVKKADQIKSLGQDIYWENIGDPITKKHALPAWIKDVVSDIVSRDESYAYCPSKGVLGTREFLAERTNKLGDAQITADDICFFNGLGDAIFKVYQNLASTSRVIVPTPTYSTHSSGEAFHAKNHSITFRLNPDNRWYPDVEDLYNKVKYNANIVGILIVNPDNPTGMVYPLEILQQIVAIAREFNLFIISDEIYQRITYNGERSYCLSEYIGDVPGIAMKGISKEIPWPGSRCGWLEYYNRTKDKDFERYCAALDNSKMVEVCSTRVPQMAIPKILGDSRYDAYLEEKNLRIGRRSRIVREILGDVPEIYFNETFGAFYNAIIFKQGILRPGQSLPIKDVTIKNLVESWLTDDMPLDKRFVYYLLGATGVCVAPISSFLSDDLLGFRVTLLETDEVQLRHIFTTIKENIVAYRRS